MGKRKSYRDFDMLKQLRQGGAARERAMRQLYLAEAEGALQYLRKLGCDDEAAQDVFQDAVVELLIAIEEEKFQGQSSLKTYLFGIAKHLWFARLRRQGVEQRYQDRLMADPTPERPVTPEGLYLRQHQQEKIDGVLQQLGDACREVLTLWSLRYDMKEIATRMGYANDQIARNKKSRCLQRLKQLVSSNPAVRELVQELVGS